MPHAKFKVEVLLMATSDRTVLLPKTLKDMINNIAIDTNKYILNCQT